MYRTCICARLWALLHSTFFLLCCMPLSSFVLAFSVLFAAIQVIRLFATFFRLVVRSVSFSRITLVRQSHFSTLYYTLIHISFVCRIVANALDAHSTIRFTSSFFLSFCVLVSFNIIPSWQAIFCYFALIAFSRCFLFACQWNVFTVELISAIVLLVMFPCGIKQWCGANNFYSIEMMMMLLLLQLLCTDEPSWRWHFISKVIITWGL